MADMTETRPMQRCCRGQGSKRRLRSSGQSCSRIIKKSSGLLWALAEAMVRWGRCGQIWGEGTVRRPVGFSLLMPPSRMQTRGKATLTRCAANCEKGKGEKKVSHHQWFYPVFPAYAFSSSPLKPASRHAAIAATTQRNFQNPATSH